MRPIRPLSVLAACAFAASSGAQVTISPGPATFVDISTTGTALLNAGDDTVHAFTSTIGNELFPAGPVLVTTNGTIFTGATTSLAYWTNYPITATTNGTLFGHGATTRVICPWWDDLYAGGFPNSTLYWKEMGGVLYIQYTNIAHYPGPGGPGIPAITFQVQIVQQTCGGTIRLVYPDAAFGGVNAQYDFGASATVGYVGGTAATNAQWSFDTPSVATGTSLVIRLLSAVWSSPIGTGSLLVSVCGGPPSGAYQVCATVNAGAFPNGWFFGLDALYSELDAQIGVAPFFGPLSSNGAAFLGPFTGLPSGLVIYSFVFGIPPGNGPPLAHTSPFSYAIP